MTSGLLGKGLGGFGFKHLIFMALHSWSRTFSLGFSYVNNCKCLMIHRYRLFKAGAVTSVLMISESNMCTSLNCWRGAEKLMVEKNV